MVSLPTELVTIHSTGVFSLKKARHLLPVVKRITKQYSETIDQLIEKIENLPSLDHTISAQLENQIHSLIEDWRNKIQGLGAKPNGLWIVDFDSGQGYFCWKYPEPDILYWHKYTDGYTGRIPVADMINMLEE